MENTENTENTPIISNLSEPEKYILDNKNNYIKLNEDDGEVTDVTKDLLSLCDDFKLGQMIHTDNFTLEETMNAVELDHFKMDSHYNYKAANTYRKLLREGKIKKMVDLTNEETLSLIDNLMVRETMWLYGSPIYQTIFNLVYFTDNSINSIKSDDSIFRIFLDSTLHIIYLTFSAIIDCGCLREEDIMMIPVQNASELKREKVFEELKEAEINIKNKLKYIEVENTNTNPNTNSNEEKKTISTLRALLNRIKLRKDFIKIIEEQFDFENNKRYENLIIYVNSIKVLLAEIKSDIPIIEEHVKSTEVYFCDNLCKIAPSIANIKLVSDMKFSIIFEKLEKLLNNLTSVSKIYDMNDYYVILKSTENLNNEKPSFLIRSILELNLFPKNSNKLLNTIDYSEMVHKNLAEFKINFLDESSDLITNLVSVNKEMLLNNLKNRTRQVRDSNTLFEGLAFLVLEANHMEKEMMKKDKKAKKSILTNVLLRQNLQEMMKYIWTSFELELFSGFELDYIFYVIQQIVHSLCSNTNLVAGSFGEKILKEEDFVRSNSKKKLTPSQKMVIDEIHIYNGLRCALKGIALMCRYAKISGLITNPQTEEKERLRIANRFPIFKNTKYFLDLSYDAFVRDMYFEIKTEKEMILQSADSYLKQAIKYLNELKGADLKLRDGFHYSNSFIDNLSKSIICNNMLLSKIKKLDKKGLRLTYTLKKYDTFLPILEIN